MNDAEHLAQADRVDRLAADLELVNTLAFGKFEGREYRYLALGAKLRSRYDLIDWT